MNLTIEKIKRADFCFFPVTPATKNLQVALGDKAPSWPYAKAYLPIFVSSRLKIYKSSGQARAIGDEDFIEPIFLGNEPFCDAIKESSEKVEECINEYHSVIISKQNDTKYKAWVFGLPALLEKLYQKFNRPGIFAYIHEINFSIDKLFLITIEPFRGNEDIPIPDTHLLSSKKIFNLS